MQEASPAGSRQESGERQVRDMIEARSEARSEAERSRSLTVQILHA